MRPEKLPLGMAQETKANISETKKDIDCGPSLIKDHGRCPPLGIEKIGQANCLMANPPSRNATTPTPMWPVIFIMTLVTSRERTWPPSSKKKPACMRKIRPPIESNHNE